MANQIYEMVLFYSNYSKESIACAQFITTNKIPALLVKLDNPDIREAVMNGTSIQIRSVPSLLISFTDATIQLYVGRQKIIPWFQNIMSRSDGNRRNPDSLGSNRSNQHIPSNSSAGYHPQQTYNENEYNGSNNNQYYHPQNASQYNIKKTKGTKTQNIIENEKSENESSEEEIIVPKKQKKNKKTLPQSKKITSTKKTKRNKRNPIPENDDEVTELIFDQSSEQPNRPPPLPTSGLLTTAAPKNNFNKLKDDATRMMREREESLGYGSERF